MSQPMLKIPLSELSAVRVRCKGKKGDDPCGLTFEMPLARLVTAFAAHGGVFECPACHASYSFGATNPFKGFAEGVATLLGSAAAFEVEFLVGAP